METTNKIDEGTTKAATITSLNVEIEELEGIMAPVTGIIRWPGQNHNETLVRDEEIELKIEEIEELEEIMAPVAGILRFPGSNHNETLVLDDETSLEL